MIVLYYFLGAFTLFTVVLLGYVAQLGQFIDQTYVVSQIKKQLISYYRAHGVFPSSLSIPYPVYSYRAGGDPTDSYGIGDTPAYAVVDLSGKDRKIGTGDDVVITLTASELEQPRLQELERRGRILEQTAYNVCQRRRALGLTPHFPQNLNQLITWGNLPDYYKETPFGREYTYDLSSCNDDECYCTKSIVGAPQRP